VEQSQDVRELVSRVRTRWRRVVVLRATGRTALALSGVLGTLLLLAFAAGRAPVVLAGLAIAAIALAVGSAVWGLWPARDVPSDRRVARFIEEHEPSLDDRLVSAVDLLGREREETPALATSMVTDANRRAAQIDPAGIVSTRSIRRAALWAAVAVLLVAVVAFLGRGTARSSFAALSFLLFPSGVTLDVTPGDARIAAGTTLTVEARLTGDGAAVDVQMLLTDAPADPTEPVSAGTEWQAAPMTRLASGAFRFAIESVEAPFRYRVVAGALSSPVYGVTVARAPRVTRVDVEYSGASALGFEPRVETDSGDIFAPAGTDIRLVVHTDIEAAKGQMRLANGQAVDLSPDGLVLTGAYKVLENTSYRVALADAEGLANPGDIEYFIRTLEDRPPDVQLSRPARDREVTRLEEVDIEAQADDDFGVEVLELVYAKGGGAETVVPLAIERRARSVKTAHTLELENLNLQTGDFISYYVRARDVARGKPPSEARSDIFFLHVRPFEQEFQLAQGQPPAGGGANRALDDVVTAQKEIILATWRLDRRAQTNSGAVSEEDIRTVSLAESELQARVEETSSSFRTSAMRDPRRPAQPSEPGGASAAPRAGVALPEEDSMSAAAESMGRAVWSLDLLNTVEALPHEMEALGHLLKAQGDVKRREVGGQQTGSGTGDNRTSQDLSGLFDKELQREQQTNYETPAPPQPPGDTTQSALDKVKELAHRQEALARRQQDVADEQKQLTPEELKEELGQLAKEQSSLSQRADEMARQMSSDQQQPGQESRSGQQGQTAQGTTASGRQLRAASDEMRRAATELERQNPEQAAANASRALGQLRQVEQQLGATAPDERRRALGEMQLEARQLADAQRRVGTEAGKLEAGDQSRDAMRRMASEQERLAERASQLQEGLERQAASPLPENRSETDAARQLQRTAGDAAQEIERQQVVERMEQAASEMRSTAAGDQPAERDARADAQRAGARSQAGQEIAQALERIADQLATAVAPQDDESKQLTAQLAQAQQLREKLEGLTRELERLDREADERQSQDQAANAAGRGGQGQGADDPNSAELARLRDEMARQVQETREMIESLGRDNPEVAQGGSGFTFESGGMTLSDPGTEAFKQDFTQWEQLQQQLTQALEKAESSLAERLRARASRDRLLSSPDDVPPAEYQQQVDSYFKALATKKKP
jgi:hypothetical protein